MGRSSDPGQASDHNDLCVCLMQIYKSVRSSFYLDPRVKQKPYVAKKSKVVLIIQLSPGAGNTSM